MHPLRKIAMACIVATALAVPVSSRADDAASEHHIRHLMMAMFDKPDAPLDVGPVVIVDDRAIAGWTQGEMGGRALLRESTDGTWTLVLCAGDGLKAAATLEQAGIPTAQATAMATALAEAERPLDPARLALFSRFEGVVMMDEQGHHPDAHHAHGQGQGT